MTKQQKAEMLRDIENLSEAAEALRLAEFYFKLRDIYYVQSDINSVIRDLDAEVAHLKGKLDE